MAHRVWFFGEFTCWNSYSTPTGQEESLRAGLRARLEQPASPGQGLSGTGVENAQPLQDPEVSDVSSQPGSCNLPLLSQLWIVHLERKIERVQKCSIVLKRKARALRVCVRTGILQARADDLDVSGAPFGNIIDARGAVVWHSERRHGVKFKEIRAKSRVDPTLHRGTKQGIALRSALDKILVKSSENAPLEGVNSGVN